MHSAVVGAEEGRVMEARSETMWVQMSGTLTNEQADALERAIDDGSAKCVRQTSKTGIWKGMDEAERTALPPRTYSWFELVSS